MGNGTRRRRRRMFISDAAIRCRCFLLAGRILPGQRRQRDRQHQRSRQRHHVDGHHLQQPPAARRRSLRLQSVDAAGFVGRHRCRLSGHSRHPTGQDGPENRAENRAENRCQRHGHPSVSVPVPVASQCGILSLFVSFHVPGQLFGFLFHFFRLPRRSIARIPVHLKSSRIFLSSESCTVFLLSAQSQSFFFANFIFFSRQPVHVVHNRNINT